MGIQITRGVLYRNLPAGLGLIFFSFGGGEGAQHPLYPETPLKTIDFADPGGALDPQ